MDKLENKDQGLDSVELQDELPSAAGLLITVGFLTVCFAVVVVALWEMSQARFWEIAPVFLKKAFF
ncbi:MAG TPA: hypothetical protein VK633_13120 [Verrucomicrobiae bacterium]|nr:hypothetical protein [Verrucomicrobiae bacterium]